MVKNNNGQKITMVKHNNGQKINNGQNNGQNITKVKHNNGQTYLLVHPLLPPLNEAAMVHRQITTVDCRAPANTVVNNVAPW